MTIQKKNRFEISKRFSFSYSVFIIAIYNALIETVRRPKRRASEQLGIQMSIFFPLIRPPVSETRY